MEKMSVTNVSVEAIQTRGLFDTDTPMQIELRCSEAELYDKMRVLYIFF
jgi:hypothetical protein